MSEIVGLTCEKLGQTGLYISEKHRFGTDAFLLADFAAPRHKDTAADLCSGCGIVAAVMYERFRPKSMIAVEIDREGTELFERTIAESELSNVTAVCADLKNWRAEHELDLITCNPPYFAENSGFISPTAANARHELLCSFEDVCRTAKLSLKYGGRLCVCNRPERLCDMMTAMRSNGIEPKRLRFVAKNPDSPPWLALLEGKKGGKAFLTVEKTMYTTQPDGSFTEELLSCYLSG